MEKRKNQRTYREASCGRTVAKYSIHNPKIVALNPSAGTRREKIAIVIVSSYSTVVEPLASDREVEGSNPAFNCHQKKRNGRKKFKRKSSKWRRGKIRGHTERPAAVQQWQKQSIHNPKIVASNPSAGTRREKMAKIVMLMANSYSTVVEPLTSNCDVEGLNPASNWHQEKKWKKKV